MFSGIPAFYKINTISPISSLGRFTEIHHSVSYDQTYRSEGRYRKEQNHCIFHYTISGQGEVIYKNKSYKTRPGEGFFNIINDCESGYGYPENAHEPWEFIVLCMDGGNTREFVSEMLSQNVIYKINNQFAFKKLCLELAKGNLFCDQNFSLISQLISLIYHQELNPICEKFVNITAQTFMQNPTIESIANDIGVSREHLQRTFKSQYGKSCAKHIDMLRLNEICSLLSTGNMTELEISEQMNFASLSSMINFFRKHTGVSPGQYRKSNFFFSGS